MGFQLGRLGELRWDGIRNVHQMVGIPIMTVQSPEESNGKSRTG